MKGKTKTILFACVGLVLVIGAILFFLLTKGNKNITLSFDALGGVSVEKMVIKKDSTAKLPVTTKDGYIFNGWLLDGNLVNNDTIFKEDSTLVASWLKEDAKTFTITFDANGGKSVESLTLECDKEINLPTTTRKGYNFVSWTDKNDKVISSGALLACEDITLKANWSKETTTTTKTTKTTSTTTTTTTTLTKKNYTCPSGYKLDGTKCIAEGTVKEKCGDKSYENVLL